MSTFSSSSLLPDDEEIEGSAPIYGKDYEGLLNEEVVNKYSALFRYIMVTSAAMIVLGFAIIADPLGRRSTSRSSLDAVTTSTAGMPNIVFLLIDDMGYNSIDSAIMPFTTQLMSSGITFTNYYTQESCTPSRASLMTGRYPISIGWQFDVVNIDQDEGLGLNQTTFVELLKDVGYTTHMLGKWHLGNGSPRYLPTARGFDYYFGYLGPDEYYWSKRVTGGTEYTRFHDIMYSDSDCYYAYDADDLKHYSTHLYQDAAVSIIGSHDYDTSPLFLYMAFQAVHEPFTDVDSKYSKGIPEDYVDKDVYEYIQEKFPGNIEQQYYMALSVADGAIEEIYNAVDDAGQLDNTYFLFASDNGGCAKAGGRNYPLRGQKGSLFEGGTKVEAFVFNSQIKDELQGTNYTGLFHVSDWFPTILDMAHVEYEAEEGYQLDGISQYMSIFSGSSNHPREFLLYNMYHTGSMTFDSEGGGAIRNSRYKLMHYYDGSTWYSHDGVLSSDDDYWSVSSDCSQSSQMFGTFTYFLFDLQEDPTETTNLYNSDSSYEAIQDELYTAIDRYTSYYTSSANDKDSEKCYDEWHDADDHVVPWVSGDSVTGMRKDAAIKSWPSYCGTYSSSDFGTQGLVASQGALSATSDQIESGALAKYKPLSEEERALVKARRTRRRTLRN